jgi:NAD(P)-dependent dehydrogenase (short-subunit alcohol dehydrogenase family)
VGRLQNKVVLITGAGSGIGKACAVLYAAEGAKVVLASLDNGAKVAAAEITASGAQASGYRGDVSEESSVTEMVELTLSTYGRIDVLHNNAAMTSPDAILADGDVAGMTVDLWDRVMAVNLRGPMLCAKHVIPHMLRQGGGSIITTGSAKALRGDNAQTAYGASKAAVHNLTYNIAAQYGKQGIRANVLMVGLVLSDALRANFPEPVRKIMERHKLTPFIGTPEDCAKAALFLASDESRYTTGQNLFVDGGFTSHAPSLADFRDLFASPGPG